MSSDVTRITRLVITLEDGTFLNVEIIKRGYGHAYTCFPLRCLEQLREYEREAREARRGLWGGPDVSVPGARLASYGGIRALPEKPRAHGASGLKRWEDGRHCWPSVPWVCRAPGQTRQSDAIEALHSLVACETLSFVDGKRTALEIYEGVQGEASHGG